MENKFIDYDDLYKILHKKYKATHNEIRYWIYNSALLNNNLFAFTSDIPQSDGIYPRPGWNTYSPSYNESFMKFEPKFCFYDNQSVNNFKPLPNDRLVYIKDLSGLRGWSSYSKSETTYYSNFPALDKAAENGILRFYDNEKEIFTFCQLSPNKELRRLWIYTSEGQHYLSDPDKFFLLYDIINIERVFYKRPLDECLKELEININDDGRRKSIN